MRFSAWNAKTLLGAALCVTGLCPTLFACGALRTAHVYAWTAFELVLSVLCSSLIGLASMATSGRRSARVVDMMVSRGIEVAAALPIVLACAVSVVAYGWRMPIAIGLVTGVLNGLRCLRLITMSRLKAPTERRRAVALSRQFASFRHAAVASVADIVPQVVGLEATLECLALFDTSWQGGLGKLLGLAITTRNISQIFACSTISMGLAVLTQQTLHRQSRFAAGYATDNEVTPQGPN